MSQMYRKNKYHNKRCRCNANHIHQSKGEAGYCNDLALQVKAGVIEKYESQKKFEICDNEGKHISNHFVDFLVHHFDGKKEIHEYKGVATELWKLKMALTKSQYPDIPYIVIYEKKGRYR
jgi:N-acetylglucosamine-6-phosphate deacetylase